MNKVRPFGKFFRLVLSSSRSTGTALSSCRGSITATCRPSRRRRRHRHLALRRLRRSPTGRARLRRQRLRLLPHPAGARAQLRRRHHPRLGHGHARRGDGKRITRRTYPRDYIWQGQIFLGNSRDGADLSNVANRFPTPPALPLPLRSRHRSIRTAACLPTASSSSRAGSAAALADDALVLTGGDRPARRLRGRAHGRRQGARRLPALAQQGLPPARRKPGPVEMPADRRTGHERREPPTIESPEPRSSRPTSPSVPTPPTSSSSPTSRRPARARTASHLALPRLRRRPLLRRQLLRRLRLRPRLLRPGLGGAAAAPTQAGPCAAPTRPMDARQVALQRQLRQLPPGQRRGPARLLSAHGRLGICARLQACSPPSCSTACRARSPSRAATTAPTSCPPGQSDPTKSSPTS